MKTELEKLTESVKANNAEMVETAKRFPFQDHGDDIKAFLITGDVRLKGMRLYVCISNNSVLDHKIEPIS